MDTDVNKKQQKKNIARPHFARAEDASVKFDLENLR